MFDCRTNRTPIEQLGSIGFDWFLVRFRSISYAGLIPTVNRRNYSSLATKRLSLLAQRKLLLAVFINTVLLLLDVKLLVYGEKRLKPKLICLQYATLYSTTQVLLFEIFQKPNKIN